MPDLASFGQCDRSSKRRSDRARSPLEEIAHPIVIGIIELLADLAGEQHISRPGLKRPVARDTSLFHQRIARRISIFQVGPRAMHVIGIHDTTANLQLVDADALPKRIAD